MKKKKKSSQKLNRCGKQVGLITVTLASKHFVRAMYAVLTDKTIMFSACIQA